MDKSHFLIDPKVVFLNHGSFGACPKSVFEAYQGWQLELERQPVEFLGRRIEGLLDQARVGLAAYLNAAPDNLIFVQNATSGVNIAARSLCFQTGDEILTTTHEYGACDTTWERVCAKTGAVYCKHPIPLPLVSDDAFVETLWNGVTSRTRIIYLSHITSPTALIFPVAEVCRRARDAGILTVIDGAHAPGQIPVDLAAIGSDFYTGNCHKWMCAPKGAAFLHVRHEHQAGVEPLMTSWGYTLGDTFLSRLQMQGTRDPAAYLTVPTAIQFLYDHQWDHVSAECHTLAITLQDALNRATGLAPLCDSAHFGQMFTAALPPTNPAALKTRLYDEFRIEIPVIEWDGGVFIRASIQAYNTAEDGVRLLAALRHLEVIA